MQLVKELITIPSSYSITEEAEEVRNAFALRGASIHSVTCADDNERAGQVVRELRTHIKSVEAMRQTLTKPLLDGQRLLKALSDDHCAPLVEEQQRLERLAGAFAQAEARRVAAEEAKRRLEWEKAEAARVAAEESARKAAERATTDAGLDRAIKLEAKAQAAAEKVAEVIAAPMPTAARVSGQQTRQVLCWEVTDLHALVAARPDLCKIEPKASAIQATCVPNMPNLPPGLRLWYENKTIFTTR
jgi:hypothetical protein